MSAHVSAGLCRTVIFVPPLIPASVIAQKTGYVSQHKHRCGGADARGDGHARQRERRAVEHRGAADEMRVVGAHFAVVLRGRRSNVRASQVAVLGVGCRRGDRRASAARRAAVAWVSVKSACGGRTGRRTAPCATRARRRRRSFDGERHAERHTECHAHRSPAYDAHVRC